MISANSNHLAISGQEKRPLRYIAKAFDDFCGGGGIRTPGTFRYDGFQDRSIKPLWHSSVAQKRSAKVVHHFEKQLLDFIPSAEIDIFLVPGL